MYAHIISMIFLSTFLISYSIIFLPTDFARGEKSCSQAVHHNLRFCACDSCEEVATVNN